MRISFRAISLALFFSVLPSLSLFADDQHRFLFQDMTAHAQFRDAVFANNGLLYVAAYDQGELWVFENPLEKPVARIPVGQGPVALAIDTSGAVLASANRLDNSVTLVRIPEGLVYATVATGQGPADICALPQGGFITANCFSDSLSIIDAQGEGQSTSLDNAASVPALVSATQDFIAVAGRADKKLRLFPSGKATASGEINLPDSPVALAPLNNKAFLVATHSTLCIIEPKSRRISHKAPLAAKDIALLEAEIYAMTGETLLRLSPSLRIEEEIPFSTQAVRMALAPKAGVLLSPAQRTWQVWADGSASAAPSFVATPAPATQALRIVEAEDADAPEEQAPPATPPATKPAVNQPQARDTLIIEEATDPSEAATSPPEASVNAAEKKTPLTDITAPAPQEETSTAPQENQPVSPAPAEESIQNLPETDPASLPKKTVKTELESSKTPLVRSRYQRAPVPTGAVRAPSPGRRPGVAPIIGDFNQRTVTDALKQPTQLGAPGVGFQAPDWTEPLRDVEAGVSTTDLSTGKTVLKDSVKLRLGEMLFEADSFSYTDEARAYEADGAVKIFQGESELHADSLHYRIPDESLVEEKPTDLFLEDLDEQGQAKKRLTLGHVKAENIYINEPSREMHADLADFDFATHTGELHNVKGRAGIYYYAAEKINILGEQSVEAENVWISTCDEDHAYYKLRLKKLYIENGEAASGSDAQLHLGKMPTPLYLPKWRRGGRGKKPFNFDFDSGRRAELGYYINLGHRTEFSPDWALGPRIYATEKEGVGFGADWDYDYTKTPASRLFLSKGEAHALYTTEDRHYLEWQHRWEYDDDLVLRMQVEHWGDRDFYKDFYYDQYRHRTTPRTFANLSYRQPGYIATGTVRASSHGWTRETERLPEATFHLLERPLADNLYLSFDTVNGYNNREPDGEYGARTVNVARLTYPLAPVPSLSLTPFFEAEGSWYSHTRNDQGSEDRISFTTGATLQTRLHRIYGGNFGFAAFKHIVVPSLTYSYRPTSSMDVEDAPRFDALDNVNGFTRIESKLDNILYGKDAESGEVWQVGRLTLYQGNDFWNENRKSDDYEIEVDLRPRPWWGFQLVGERHVINDDMDLDAPYLGERLFLDLYEKITGNPFDADDSYGLNTTYGDYSRLLTQLYYDDTAIGGKFSSRLGFAYTETQSRTYNREILYGLGYRLGEKWGLAFEHRYDFETDDLRSQSYELRRSFNCIETAIRVRDRESGTDIDVEFNITAFPGTKLKF